LYGYFIKFYDIIEFDVVSSEGGISMSVKLGFIGAGNMGGALIRGVVKAGTVQADHIYISDTDRDKILDLSNSIGVNSAADNAEVVEKSDVIILAVKPNVVKSALESCKHAFDDKKILVSIAAGIPIKAFKGILGISKKVVRTIPNTPAMVGEGITVISFDDNINGDEADIVKEIFKAVGTVEVLDEKLMSEVVSVTSSSPAYVFMLIEAMADAAVLSGIPRGVAYRMAAQAIMGSARMVLETGKHPGELKDQVCSPAGTTIEAVRALEKSGFRSSVIEAMDECTKKARDLGKLFG
jgi:pyrroline-5-carboxylate reductase